MSKSAVLGIVAALVTAGIAANVKVLFSISDRLARIETKMEMVLASRNMNTAKLP